MRPNAVYFSRYFSKYNHRKINGLRFKRVYFCFYCPILRAFLSFNFAAQSETKFFL